MLIEHAVAKALAPFERSKSCVFIALSAGIDSTVLLHAAAQVCSSSGHALKAIHVHHGLSGNANDWAKHAEHLCEKLSQCFSIEIECIVEKVQLNQKREGLEQAARSARYGAFLKHCRSSDVLLQGHHLDDQIETFFMRAIRGSGLTGLASIPKQRPLSRANACQIIRPLLAFEKTQLIDYAKKNQLVWVEDESNQDSALDRNWWRNTLLPQIWQRYPERKKSLSRTIENVQHEQQLLQSLLQGHLNTSDTISVRDGDIPIHTALKHIPSFDLSLLQELNPATILSYLRAWLAQYIDILPSSIQMQSIYAEMILAKEDSEPQVRWSTFCLCRYRNCLYLLKDCTNNTSIAHTDFYKPIHWQGQDLKGFGGQLTCKKQSSGHSLMPGNYVIRCWQPGDVAKPAGRSTRKMKKWWQDYKVPGWIRQQWPLIIIEETNEIVAVPGLFICEGYMTPQNQLGWLLSYKVI